MNKRKMSDVIDDLLAGYIRQGGVDKDIIKKSEKAINQLRREDYEKKVAKSELMGCGTRKAVPLMGCGTIHVNGGSCGTILVNGGSLEATDSIGNSPKNATCTEGSIEKAGYVNTIADENIAEGLGLSLKSYFLARDTFFFDLWPVITNIIMKELEYKTHSEE
jgi:hypothetical protein